MTRAVRSGARARAFVVEARVLAMLALGSSLLVAAGAAAKPAIAGRAASGPTEAEESSAERRAVRGSPIDDGPESAELGELRRFEEEAFPRSGSGFGASGAGDSDSPEEPPTSLPGRWEGSGDVPEVLRSPELTTEPSRTLPVPASEWLRALKLPELPVRWDPAVLRYLEYFRSNPRGRGVMTSWLRRAGRFRALIESTLEREGLPKDLFYIAMVESGFDTGARSRVGAGGIWQFMPGAARAYGLEVGYWVDARRDPERSAEAAARYLKDLYVRFGSWHLVFAAYNAGYGAVLKSITRYNTNDYWELCRHEAGLPWESSLYVPKILAAAIVGHNLEAFGFSDVVPDPPFSYDRVDVPGGTALATVARAADCKPDTLTALNPQLTRDRVPPDRGLSSVRIPLGTKDGFVASFERDRGTNDRLETVTLRFGETLEAVAKSRGTTVRELRRLNGVRDSAELRAGVAIVVPRRKGGPPSRDSLEATRDAGAPGGSAATLAEAPAAGNDPQDEVLVAVPDRVFNYDGRERVFYQTRDADTLDEVAEVFGVRVDDLVEWNNLDATAKLHPRMVLQIFVKKNFDPREVVLLDPARVRVVILGSQDFLELEAARHGKKRLVVEARPGDTLIRLGRRYGLTVGDLARINRFAYNTELHGGQRIVVYSPSGEPTREVAHGMTAEPRRDRGDDAKGPAARESTRAHAQKTPQLNVSAGRDPNPRPAALVDRGPGRGASRAEARRATATAKVGDRARALDSRSTAARDKARLAPATASPRQVGTKAPGRKPR